jgi:dTDP-glucose pyrophosphorylase/predicted transcriptional regulator
MTKLDEQHRQRFDQQATVMKSIDQIVVATDSSIREVMLRIDRGAVAIALVVGSDGGLEGTVSDGDIRRALLAGAGLDDLAAPFVSRDPVTVAEGTDRAAVLDLMRARRLNQIPVVDGSGRLVGLHVVRELLGAEEKPNWAVVLAGGRGTRLGSLTASTPKPMLPVAGRPILERIVLHLVGSGISQIYLAVGHLAEQICDHFGDGSDHGCTIRYLEENPAMPMGTGGPLRGLLARGAPPTDPVLVMNGDLVTSFSVAEILQHHMRAGASATVALREYVHDVPFGVAQIDEAEPAMITRFAEKPRWSGLVNAGIYVIEPRLLELIPEGVNYPITELIETCLDRGDRVAGWHVTDDWQDIGRPREFARARGEHWQQDQ